MKHWQRYSLARLTLTTAALLAIAAGPRNVLVVVNDQSLQSLELGQYYRSARAIPEINICHISVPPAVQGFPATYDIAATNFTNNIRTPILNHIAANGLTNQIDYIVFSRDIPYRVGGTNGITSAMFYGHKNFPAFPLPPTTENFYYAAEQAFSRRSNTNDYYLSMMLTAWTLDEAKQLVDRAVAGDGTFPQATAYLLKSSDVNRNVRYVQFNNVDFLCRFIPSMTTTTVLASSISGETNVIGYLTANAAVADLESNTYFPGALGDHMTSFGGFLFESSGQMSILDLIKNGLCASHGTIIEPYNFQEKFPHALAYYWYARGFSVADSYWMSVQNPYMGLFVGEPLCAPYARPPLVSITNPATNATVSGSIPMTVNAVGTQDPVAQIDIFVDDRFLATCTNVPPTPGNRVTATIDGSNISYTVMTNDTLADVAAGLATNISQAPGLLVDAIATPDRVMLVYAGFGTTGSHIAYDVSCATGTAAILSLQATNESTTLLECLYPAREAIFIPADSPDNGDVLRLTITLESAVSTTNEITAGLGDTAEQLLIALHDAVNSDTNLQSADGVLAADTVTGDGTLFWLQARTPGPQGFNIFMDFEIEGTGLNTNYAFSSQLDDNGADLTARGQIMLAAGLANPVSTYTVDTTTYANGPHRLAAVAYDGSARQTQGSTQIVVVVSNNTLSCTTTQPTNNQVFVLGDSVTSLVTVAGELGVVTQVSCFVEGKIVASQTNAPFEFTWQTIDYGLGSVTLQAQAFDNSGPRAVSPAVTVMIIITNDADRDALPDSWERSHFGGIYLQSGTNNADSDLTDNRTEYVADTDPNDADHYFAFTNVSTNAGGISITFPSSTGRLYTVSFVDVDLTTNTTWTNTADSPFAGNADAHTWIDTGDINRTHPTNIPHRYYRVNAALP